MSETKFTKGPWRASERLTASENHKGWIILAATGYPVGEVYPLNQDPSPAARANARLIAAAPTMYEALKYAQAELRQHSLAGSVYNPALQKIRAALALVDGEVKESK